MKIGRERSRDPPALRILKLDAPEFFRHGHVGRAGGPGGGEHDAFERQCGRPQRFGEAKGERAAGKDLARRVAHPRGIRRGELQLGGVQRAGGIPECSRAAFGDDVEPVVPRTGAQGAERGEPVFVEIEDSTGFVGQTREFHRSKLGVRGGRRFTAIHSLWRRAFHRVA